MAAVNATFSPLAQFLANPTEWTKNTTFSTLATAISVFLLSSLFLRPRNGEKVYYLGGIPLVTAWPFFTRRYDFMREHFKESGGKMFRFKVLKVSSCALWIISVLIASMLQHQVTAMSGEKLRKVFYNEPGFNMTEGYRILMGGAPEIKDVQIQTNADGEDAQNDVAEGFIKRLLTLMRRDRISDSECTIWLWAYHL